MDAQYKKFDYLKPWRQNVKDKDKNRLIKIMQMFYKLPKAERVWLMSRMASDHAELQKEQE